MLILNRKCQEAVIISEELRLEVTEIADTHCTLTLTGPEDIVPEPTHIRVDCGESFNLAELVKVELLGIRKKTVARLGFTADRHIVIDREEIHLEKLECANASSSPPTGEKDADSGASGAASTGLPGSTAV